MTNFSYNFIKSAKYGSLLLAEKSESTNLVGEVHFDSTIYAYEIDPSQKAEFEIWAAYNFVSDSGTEIDNIIWS